MLAGDKLLFAFPFQLLDAILHLQSNAPIAQTLSELKPQRSFATQEFRTANTALMFA